MHKLIERLKGIKQRLVRFLVYISEDDDCPPKTTAKPMPFHDLAGWARDGEALPDKSDKNKA